MHCGIPLVPSEDFPGYYQHTRPAGHYPDPFRVGETGPEHYMTLLRDLRDEVGA